MHTPDSPHLLPIRGAASGQARADILTHINIHAAATPGMRSAMQTHTGTGPGLVGNEQNHNQAYFKLVCRDSLLKHCIL